MGETVGGGVAERVVDGDLPRVEVAQRRSQHGLEALVVGEDGVEEAMIAQGRAVRPADDGDALAGARDEESALPGDVVAENQLERGVGRLGGLAGEGQPAIDVLLFEDAYRLFDLLALNGNVHERPSLLTHNKPRIYAF